MRKFIVFLSVVLLLTFVAGYLFVTNAATDYEFTISSSEVEEEVKIVFDEMAVPHIYAESETDAMFALGYVHASERLWQMDLIRRAGAGTLSELFGSDMIENDKYLRPLGMKEAGVRSAAEFLKNAPPNISAAAQAYLKGVNFFIDEGKFPIEYTLLGSSPAHFKLENLFETAGFMGYSFAMAFKNEPIIDWITKNFDSSYMDDLAVTLSGNTTIPVTRSNENTQSSDLTFITQLANDLEDNLPVPQFIGSNSWVISGSKTKSGEVLFSNDAHMLFASPSVWYEAHITTPEVEYYGNHLAGMPFPPLGHTKSHAWGLTMFVNDDIDFYQEKIEGDKYYFGGEWKDLEIVKDVIKVKDAPDEEIIIRKTHHGPIIFDDVAMWWTYTQYPDNLMNEAFYGLSRATTIDQIENSASLIHAPGLNIMYGDDKGNVAWWASAKLPIRGDSVNCKVIIDGTNPANDIQGWYDFSKNPQSVNPESGFIFSANNSPEEVDGVHYPGYYYSGNTRAASIQKALSTEKSDWTIEDSQAMQLSNYSPVYEKNCAMLVEYMSGYKGGEYADFFEVMKAWKGTHEVDEIAPTIYYRWMYHTLHLAFGDDMGEEKFDMFLPTFVCENSFPMILKNAKSPWWDDINTAPKDSPSDIVARAFEDAVDELQEQLGDDLSKWKYGELHTLTHKHAMGDVKFIGDFLNVGPFKVPSAKDALNKYEFKLTKDLDYHVFSGPSMRLVIDFADVENSESVIPTGQSGNVFSKYYDNQAEMYHSGKFRKQRMNAADIENHKISTSYVKPEK